MAVPPGVYKDSRGRDKVVVHQNGKEVYLLKRDGMVYAWFKVVSENRSTEDPNAISLH